VDAIFSLYFQSIRGAPSPSQTLDDRAGHTSV